MTIKTNNCIFLVLLFFLSSCNGDIIFTDSVAMPDKMWELSNVPDFSVTVTDTIQLTDVYFTIRTGSDYPFRNLFLFVTASSPDGNSMTDTLEYDLADEKGNWYGKGFGDIHELDLPYRTNVFFPLKGTYRFTIQHGMRVGDLNDVYDLGLRIEKSLK
ncbi:MAG: gliding motility lipoprotein GldH [Bacteroidia bacterium]|nr:gliding motility lipoprotein GldH [Bacteroidia bacterium]